jgi:hypothetical protein
MDQPKLQEQPQYQIVKYERKTQRKSNFARPSNTLTFWIELNGTVHASHLWSSYVGRISDKPVNGKPEKVYKI